jgi:DmsE family decaheme c-type cytochrome
MSKLKIGTLIIVIVSVTIWGCLGLFSRRVAVPRIKGAQYVGTQKCIEEKCHPQRMKDIADSVHHKLFEQDNINQPACELCHGKGSLHIASTGDPELILIYKEMSPKQASEVCLTCHATGALDKWYKSAHYQEDISCNDCHLSHGSSDKQILKAPDPEICYQCHSKIEQKFKLASSHKFEKQGFRCLNCHKSHEKYDTMGEENVRKGVCLECHEEYKAAFEYEHEPVKDDCLECHNAHGSEYPKLCNADIKNLCESCHPSIIHREFFIARSFPKAREKLQKGQCTACHKKVHGSKYRDLLDKAGPVRGRPSGFTPPVPDIGDINQRRMEMQSR